MQWAPCSERGCAGQPLALGCTTAQAGGIGFYRSFVDEDQSLWSFAHRRGAMLYPFVAGTADAGLASLICDQRLFLYVNPRRRSIRKIAGMPTVTPSAAINAPRSSASVMSGSCSTNSTRKSLWGPSLPTPVGRPHFFGSRLASCRTLDARRTPEAGEISKRRAADRALDPDAISSEKRRRRSSESGDGMA